MLIVDDALTDTELAPDMYMTKKVPSELPYNMKIRFQFNYQSPLTALKLFCRDFLPNYTLIKLFISL